MEHFWSINYFDLYWRLSSWQWSHPKISAGLSRELFSKLIKLRDLTSRKLSGQLLENRCQFYHQSYSDFVLLGRQASMSSWWLPSSNYDSPYLSLLCIFLCNNISLRIFLINPCQIGLITDSSIIWNPFQNQKY